MINAGTILLLRAKPSPIIEQCAGNSITLNEPENESEICRALVAEALEISSFMEKMGDANNNEERDELRELAMRDWAK